jgi:hypothetical protein
MRHISATLLTCLSVLPAGAALAQSSGNNGNANLCSPNAQSLSNITRNQYGLANTSTSSSAEVLCAVNVIPGFSSTTFFANVYNRNTTTSLACGVFELDSSGNTVASSTKSVTGSLSSGIQTITWTIPTTGGLALSSNMFVDCTIPPVQSSQNSYVTSFGWL